MFKLAIIFVSALLLSITAFANFQNAFKNGEELTFKLFYHSAVTGNVTAGEMTSKVALVNFKNAADKQHYHIKLKGRTKGAFRWFFDAEDKYETYINTKTLLPHYFKKRIQEGGYTATKDVHFNQEIGLIKTINNKNNDIRYYNTNHKVQDLLSSLYYLRNWNFDSLKIGQKQSINLFMDDSVYQIEFKFLGRKTIETSYGKTRCLIFAPKVVTGGVFGEESPMTVYVSDDKYHLPILAESKLMIGEAKIELIKAKGLRP